MTADARAGEHCCSPVGSPATVDGETDSSIFDLAGKSLVVIRSEELAACQLDSGKEYVIDPHSHVSVKHRTEDEKSLFLTHRSAKSSLLTSTSVPARFPLLCCFMPEQR